MPALRIQMHLYGNTRLLKRNVIGKRVVDIVYMIILGLEQERRWSLRADVRANIRIQVENIF